MLRSQPFRALVLLIIPLAACSVLTPSPGSLDTAATASSEAAARSSESTADEATAAAAPKATTAREAKPASARADDTRRRSRANADLNDGNVLAILVAANEAQVQYAEIALAKSKNAEIRKFALMTKFDHESVNGAVRALAKRLDIEPENTELSTSQYARAVSMRAAFRDLEGVSFDSAYIANEVEFHRTLLRTIDDVLLRAADEDELKTLLTAVRPAMTAHLEHAEVAARRVGVR